MYYLDYAKKVDDRYVLNFFADSAEDLKDVPTDKPYITRNGTNYGIPLDTSVVTIIEGGTKVNYVLQNGAYIAGGDVAPVVGTLEATENKTYLAKDENLDGYNQVVVNVQPKLQEKSATANGAVTPDSDFQGLSKVTVNVPATPTEEKTVVLALANGDQVITSTDGKNISKVTITKPVELLSENIKKGITIAGVTGTYKDNKKLTQVVDGSISELTAEDLKGVTSIRDYAFGYCSGLTNVTIPDSVTRIGYYTFNYCSSLTSITMLSTTPPTIESNTFDSSFSGTITVPAGTGATYKAATNWSVFADKIQEAAA